MLVTVFTRSVVPAHGFALACQLDKGIPPNVDYMARRRAEDETAAQILGFATVRWLDLLEAPHRGYDAAPALFGPVHNDDPILIELSACCIALSAEFQPDRVLAPQGLGNHVDHQQVIAAALRSFAGSKLSFYRDTPYAIRQPEAAALPAVPRGTPSTVPIGAVLDRKIAAAQAYVSQIGFQFGGAAPLAQAMRDFAFREGRGQPAERFCGQSLADLAGSIAA